MRQAIDTGYCILKLLEEPQGVRPNYTATLGYLALSGPYLIVMGEKFTVKLISLTFAVASMLPVVMWGQDKPPINDSYAPPTIAVGDEVSVHLYDLPETGQAVMLQVDPEGTISVPYAGTIHAAGLTTKSLGAAIVEALQMNGIVKRANVSVEVSTRSAFLGVNVIGQVISPRPIPLSSPVPLAYVIDQVGGLSGQAARKVTILHRGDRDPDTVDFDPESLSAASANTLVYPGDTVTVSSRGVFFIAGEVYRPGIYPMGGGISVGQVQASSGEGVVQHMTLLQALAQAGGITAIAARSHLHILRTVEGKRVDIEVNQVKLSEGKVADPILQPNDIIYLPPSYFRQQTNNLFGTALSSLNAAASVRTANF